MSQVQLILLACLPCLALCASLQCKYGDVTMNPGQSHVFEQNCAQHNCTCDPAKASSEMCVTKMTGCLDGASNTCYKAGNAATVAGTTGPMHCECKLVDGAYTFANCKSETCKDSRTGEQKKKGEQVTYVGEGVTYLCTCGGVDGFQNCRTEESVKNEGKCLDHASGKYVDSGAPATTKRGDEVLHCTCGGTNSYMNCRSATCPDASGGAKREGEKVTVMNSGVLLVCDCAGLGGYQNCVSKADYDNAGKCKDMDGNYADKGQVYRVKYGDSVFKCVCDGNNSGKDCTVA